MIKKTLPLLFVLCLFSCQAYPSSSSSLSSLPEESSTIISSKAGETTSTPQEDNRTMKMTIGERVFHIDLVDNKTTEKLRKMLPFEIEMSELNGNEKYHYFDSSLPTDSHNPGRIEVGDVMLYGSSCLVLFYESFDTSYSYTRIGKTKDTSGLKEALGRGSVLVSFSL